MFLSAEPNWCSFWSCEFVSFPCRVCNLKPFVSFFWRWITDNSLKISFQCKWRGAVWLHCREGGATGEWSDYIYETDPGGTEIHARQKHCSFWPQGNIRRMTWWCSRSWELFRCYTTCAYCVFTARKHYVVRQIGTKPHHQTHRLRPGPSFSSRWGIQMLQWNTTVPWWEPSPLNQNRAF